MFSPLEEGACRKKISRHPSFFSFAPPILLLRVIGVCCRHFCLDFVPVWIMCICPFLENFAKEQQLDIRQLIPTIKSTAINATKRKIRTAERKSSSSSSSSRPLLVRKFCGAFGGIAHYNKSHIKYHRNNTEVAKDKISCIIKVVANFFTTTLLLYLNSHFDD